MKLSEVVLPKLADRQLPHGERTTVSFPDAAAGWGVTLTLDRCETISYLVWEIEVHAGPSACHQDATLAEWAKRVTADTKGLLEHLKVVEIDDVSSEALIRSDTPTIQGDHLAYYEIRLAGTTRATLCRYQSTHHTCSRRMQVPFALTREVLANLLDQLVSIP